MSRQDPVPDQLRERLQSSLGTAYALERELGGGGMARVFLATDAALGRQVAVKVLSPEAAEGLSAERFTREIRLAAALQDPHIVPVLMAGQTADGLPYFTMPFVTGESLRARIGRGRLPLDEALRILRDVAEALEYAHARGVVHRDIKPENVLLSGRHAVVADFGIAKAMSAARADAGVAGLTSAGTSLGTPAYMAPEQAVGDATDHRADLYAWGMMAYELLSGAHPFAGKKTQRQLVAAQVAETPPSLGDREAGLPPGLGALVMACLAKDPTDRPADAAAVLAALDAAMSPGGTASSLASSPRQSPEPAAGRRRLASIAAVALAVLAGSIALGAWFDTRPPAVALAPDATPALAVLPFEHQGDSADAYVTDGITDEIRGRLTGVRELMVIARASSNQAAESNSSPAGIAKALGARYLLTGTVRVVGSGAERRVVVRPELVEALPDGRVQSRWQAPFDAEFSDVIAVQSDIARRVVSAMELPTSAADRLRAEVVELRDPVAYDLFLRAEAKVDGGASSDAASNLQAIPLYEAAIARDSMMVEAWGALTGSLVLAYANGVPTRALAERSRVAALRTLALDPEGVIGTTAHGLYLRLVERDKMRALEEYRRAVVASPNDPAANGGFAVALFDVGRLEEALPYFEKARRLDPRQPPRSRAVADVLAALGRLSEARELASQAWSVSPAVRAAAPRVGFELAVGDTAAARQVAEQAMRDLPTDQLLGDLASNALGWVLSPADVQRLLTLGPEAFPDGASGRALVHARHYWLQGDSARMRRWADSAQRLRLVELREVPDDTRLVMGLASAEAFRGRGTAAVDLARRAIATERRLTGGGVSRNLPELLYFAAEAALVAGDRDAALAWLGELREIPSVYTAAWLRVDPTWEGLRGDARFEEVLTRPGPRTQSTTPRTIP